jgi:hypothetical protein
MIINKTMITKFNFYFFIVFFLSTEAFSASINVVSVTSSGFGQTEAEAISEAVINGIAQVNGESIASSLRIKKATVSATDQKTQAARSIESDLERKTKGVVKSWKKVSSSYANQSYTANVLVEVFVLEKSEQLKRLKIAVVPPQSNTDELTNILIGGLSSSLASNRKFALIDKRNSEAITKELNQIKLNNGAIEDQVRLNATVAPDFIAVARINPMDSKNGKYVIEASLEIIDYATRQVKFSEKKVANLKSTDSATIHKQINLLAKNLTRVVIETLYPPIIVGADEDSVIIAQGADFFNVGDKCVIKEIKNVIRDPYTKEFLGYEQSDIGTADITYTDKRISKAKFTSKVDLELGKLTAKKYQIWRSGSSINDLYKTASTELESPSSGKLAPQDNDY